MVKKVLLLITLLVVLLSLFSCGVNNDELLGELPDMVREGRKLLNYVYGDGLSYDVNGEESYRKGYVAVSDESEFKSIAEFENALKENFTESSVIVFSRTAFVRTFEGEASFLPRYIEDEEGTLYINKEHEADILKREPDYDSFNIVKSNRYMAEVEVTMIYEDGSTEKDKFVVRKENGKWKFDSAAIL